uniref:Uncharacterized protein n=1 Tax=Rhizophora mucronata TaxID=61149 RepID=A0A2P2KAA2_RHIMU
MLVNYCKFTLGLKLLYAYKDAFTRFDETYPVRHTIRKWFYYNHFPYCHTLNGLFSLFLYQLNVESMPWS